MTRKGLFGQEFIHLYFSNLYRRCLSKRTIKIYEQTLLGFIAFLKAKTDELYRQIGQLKVENDFLSKKLGS